MKKRQVATLIYLICWSGSTFKTEAANSSLKPAAPYTYLLKNFTQNNVKVEIRAKIVTESEIFLSATFTPYPGYHLYSTRMPAKGIDGAGRPTKFDVSVEKPARLKMYGSVTDQPRPFNVIDKSLSRPLPIYPAGPVTLTRKGKYSPGASNVIVHLTYMSCRTDGGCTIPVENKELRFTLKI
ncbi:hypothetical protein MF271_06545 [Deinococcus sp. KNUC1210]|uniref:hypothetical protein n=1 Tax=Deinococcus sp. KNUC1210 TaxID=2917691 RepID=UPI001EEFD257|nr:hypothetical protein [Deinococcus sp. KNUC1210]ULH16262.1 hypothetical protein MF271_06545 [Deinococcus sp. KNUC1210]